MKILERPIIVTLMLTVLCGWLFFFRLGSMALTDPDETFYAQSAREMLDRGEWVTSYLYGKPQFEKPVLFYTLTEISFKIFGPNEFAARLPSAVFALIGVLALYLLGGAVFGRTASALSAFILATNVEYVLLARACVTDMVLAVFMLLGALLFLYGHVKNRPFFYLLSSAAFAFAALTKGPVALILPGFVICSYFLILRDWESFKRIPFLRVAAVFLLIAAPWYIAMIRIHGKVFIDSFFGFQNVTRFLQSEHEIGSQFYYNIPILLGGFFPWSLFLFAGFWHSFKQAVSADINPKRVSLFFLLWFIVIFGFFSASSTKLPTYIFPCFPALAAIIGMAYFDFAKGMMRRAMAKSVAAAYYMMPILVSAGTIGALIYTGMRYRFLVPAAATSSLFLLFGSCLCLYAYRAGKILAAFFLVVYMVVLFIYPATELIAPALEPYECSRDAGLVLSSLMKESELLGAESNYLPGLAFYTGKFPVNLDIHDTQINFVNSGERVWFVLKTKNHGHLYDPGITKQYIKPTYVIYRVGKRAVITNEMPADGKYLQKRTSSIRP